MWVEKFDFVCVIYCDGVEFFVLGFDFYFFGVIDFFIDVYFVFVLI